MTCFSSVILEKKFRSDTDKTHRQTKPEFTIWSIQPLFHVSEQVLKIWFEQRFIIEVLVLMICYNEL